MSTIAKKESKIDKVKLKKYTFKYVVSVVRLIFIIGMCFVVLFPLFQKIVLSIMSSVDLYDATVTYIPRHLTTANYSAAWTKLGGISVFLRTLGLTVCCALLNVVCATLVGYGLARFKFRGRNLIFGMAIFTLIIPTQTVLLPLFLQFKYFSPITFFTLGFNLQGTDLIGTPIPLILLSCTANGFKNGLYIFMLRQYFKNLPVALEEAAYIDGCNRFTTFWYIMLPGAKTMMITIFLFSFVWQWNDYFYSMILMPGMDVFTTVFSKVGEAITRSDGAMRDTMQMMLYDSAAMILHIIPLVVLYIFTQKFFVQSIERSGIVG